MERIKFLRQVVLNRDYSKDEFYYKFYKQYLNSKKTDKYERYTEAFTYAFDNLTPHVTDGELIVGETTCALNETEMAEWRDFYKEKADDFYKKIGVGQDSHMAIDYQTLLLEGVKGIIDRIERYAQKCDGEKLSFYKACKECLLAIVKHSRNYSLLAKRLASLEKNPIRKKELEEISENCETVPENPAKTFYQALQSVHFINYCLSLNPLRLCTQQFQLGRPDRYLLKYYENDVAEGRLTKERAQLLLDCLGLQINMMVPNGVSCGYMVGGRDENGKTVANELTMMCMQVIDDINLVYPSVGLCYHKDIPDEYLDMATKLLLSGKTHPAIFNDDVIFKGLTSYGLTEAEARNYIHSTCVEITPVGSSNVWVASPYYNTAQLLLDIMCQEYKSFDCFLNAYLNLIDENIKNYVEYFKDCRIKRAKNSVNPLLSCFVNDCLSRGLDIENGGAKYNWIMPSFVGLANVIDSIYAIKDLVYDKNKLSLTELKKIVDADFVGYKELKDYIVNDLPKYGNDIDEVDCLFSEITNHVAEECKKYTSVFSNGNIVPSAFCWIKHELFGKITGATPDGRSAGFPLGDGSGPCQGREINGPTASILSSTKWQQHMFIGGVAVNIKFSKSNLGNNSLKIMEALIKTFIERGGFELQVNVVDKKTLKDAIKNPEKYRDLLVRIGGYSDYFVKISPEMQREVMLRTEHGV